MLTELGKHDLVLEHSIPSPNSSQPPATANLLSTSMDLLILDISCTYAHASRLSASGFFHWMSRVQILGGCLCQSFGLSLAGQCPALGTTYSSLKEMCGHYASRCHGYLCSGVCMGRCLCFSWVIPSGGSGPMVAHCVSHRACALSDPHKSANSRSHLPLLRMRAVDSGG